MPDHSEDKVKSTVEKLKAAREEQERQNAVIVENQKDYAKALNSMAESPNGKLVLKILIKACGVFQSKKGADGVALIEANATRNLYLDHIRPYLEPKNRQELEN